MSNNKHKNHMAASKVTAAGVAFILLRIACYVWLIGFAEMGYIRQWFYFEQKLVDIIKAVAAALLCFDLSYLLLYLAGGLNRNPGNKKAPSSRFYMAAILLIYAALTHWLALLCDPACCSGQAAPWVTLYQHLLMLDQLPENLLRIGAFVLDHLYRALLFGVMIYLLVGLCGSAAQSIRTMKERDSVSEIDRSAVQAANHQLQQMMQESRSGIIVPEAYIRIKRLTRSDQPDKDQLHPFPRDGKLPVKLDCGTFREEMGIILDAGRAYVQGIGVGKDRKLLPEQSKRELTAGEPYVVYAQQPDGSLIPQISITYLDNRRDQL